MIKIEIKNGDLDAALDQLSAAKKEQSRTFDQQMSAFFASNGKSGTFSQTPKTEIKPAPAPEAKQVPAAPSYQSLLSRSRRAG